MTRYRSCTLMLVATAWISLGYSLGGAQAEPFYAGKTIRVLVGSGPGAGNDIRTRLFASHASKHIPGNPKLIVENMAGGGGLRTRNYLYNIAKPNGLTIAEIIRGTGLQHAIKEPAARFKADEFNWLGNLTTAQAICIGAIDRVGNSLEEAIKRSKKTQLRDGESSSASTGAAIGKLLRKFTGMDTRLVVGYRGGAKIDLTLQKGEIDLRCGFVWSSAKTRKKHWFKRLGSKKPFATVVLANGVNAGGKDVTCIALRSEFVSILQSSGGILVFANDQSATSEKSFCHITVADDKGEGLAIGDRF